MRDFFFHNQFRRGFRYSGGDAPMATPKTSRDKGRQGEFYARMLTAIWLQIPPSELLLRAKGSNGCDLWPSNHAKPKFPFAMEVKNRTRLNIFELVKQMVVNAEEGLIPVGLVINPKYASIVLTPEDFYCMVALLNANVPEWHEQISVLKVQLAEREPAYKNARFNLSDNIIHGVMEGRCDRGYSVNSA